jgi:hypothetical protein
MESGTEIEDDKTEQLEDVMYEAEINLRKMNFYSDDNTDEVRKKKLKLIQKNLKKEQIIFQS